MGSVNVVDSAKGFFNLEGNVFLGFPPELSSSVVSFEGQGNIFVCEKGVKLKNSRIKFKGNNALVVLNASKHPLRINATVWSNSVFYLGQDSFFSPVGVLYAIASDGRSVIIGNDSLFSFDVWMRTSDPHLVYSADTMKRINASKDILVGDHVWIGQEALLLKGTTIGSGSIIGGGSVCAGKVIPSNCSWAGNPAKQISKNIFFSKKSVYRFSEDDEEKFSTFKKKSYIYQSSKINHDEFLNSIYRCEMAEEKLELLQKFFSTDDKNKLALAETQKETRKKFLDRFKLFRKIQKH